MTVSEVYEEEDAQTLHGRYHQRGLGVSLKVRDCARRIERLLPGAYKLHHELIDKAAGKEGEIIKERDDTIKTLEAVIGQLRDQANQKIYNLQVPAATGKPECVQTGPAHASARPVPPQLEDSASSSEAPETILFAPADGFDAGPEAALQVRSTSKSSVLRRKALKDAKDGGNGEAEGAGADGAEGGDGGSRSPGGLVDDGRDEEVAAPGGRGARSTQWASGVTSSEPIKVPIPASLAKQRIAFNSVNDLRARAAHQPVRVAANRQAH